MTKTPLRVAQIVGKMNGGGVEAVVMNYYRNINRDRVQFDFFYTSDSTMVPEDEIKRLGGGLYKLPPYTELFAFLWELRQAFKNNQYRVVHSHLNALSCIPLSVAKIEGIPVRIAHSHSSSGRGEYVKNAVKGALRPFSNVFPTHRIACSRLAGDWLFGRMHEYSILYNAIELDAYRFDQSARDSIRSSLGIPSDSLVIGHVGRFVKQKNHEFLVEVFAECIQKAPSTVLLLVGEGELRPQIEELVDKYGLSDSVHFLGQRDDVDKIYSAFDVFVLPSLYEGLCLVGVEALRNGLECHFADSITREIELNDRAAFHSIDDGALAWADKVMDYRSYERNVDASAFVDYDIHKAAQSLEIFYYNALQETNVD